MVWAVSGSASSTRFVEHRAGPKVFYAAELHVQAESRRQAGGLRPRRCPGACRIAHQRRSPAPASGTRSETRRGIPAAASYRASGTSWVCGAENFSPGHFVKQPPAGLRSRRGCRRRTCRPPPGRSRTPRTFSTTQLAAATAQTSLRWQAAGSGCMVCRLTEAQRPAERGDRLHRRAQHDRLRVAHAGLDAAGVVGGPRETQRRRLPQRRIVTDRIVDLGAGSPGRLEAHADLDALDRRNRHHRLGQPAVEPPVPLRVRAEAEGHALGADLDQSAQRVALLLASFDQPLECRRPVGVEGIEFASIAEQSLLLDGWCRVGRGGTAIGPIAAT